MIDFSEMEPPADDKVYINQQGLVVMNVRTLAKLQDPQTFRRLQEAAAEVNIKILTPPNKKTN